MAREFHPGGAIGVPPRPDLVIAALAERQHGVVTRSQLLAAGVTDRQIAHRLELRRIRVAHDGVYEIPAPKRSPETLFIAAVLAAGRGAVLSHRSAAALRDLRPQTSGPVHVTVPRRGGGGREGIRLHTTRSLPPEDVAAIDGIPATAVPRTIIDLAAELRPREIERLLERSQQLRLFDLPAFEDALARANGRRGVGGVRRLIAQLRDDAPPTRSEFERRFLELVERAGLPRPVVNGRVCGYEVDFHWPPVRLIVETDGRATHDTPFAFERDRNRDLRLELAGWHVIRVTWRQLRDEPERIVALLRARLSGLGLALAGEL